MAWALAMFGGKAAADVAGVFLTQRGDVGSALATGVVQMVLVGAIAFALGAVVAALRNMWTREKVEAGEVLSLSSRAAEPKTDDSWFSKLRHSVQSNLPRSGILRIQTNKERLARTFGGALGASIFLFGLLSFPLAVYAISGLTHMGVFPSVLVIFALFFLVPFGELIGLVLAVIGLVDLVFY